MRQALIFILLLIGVELKAQDSISVIGVERAVQDPISVVEQPEKISWLKRVIRGFSYIDTNYVEPQHYNWSVMMQATYNYDLYSLSAVGGNGHSITFSTTPTIKVGPYFGWRWVFLGYTIDLRHVNITRNTKTFDFSFYSAQIGADIYYRRTGSDYEIRNLDLGRAVSTRALEGVLFDGINVGITGITAYYIFNHQRFSYPAAFNQSTCQKISCGSWMAGLGYLRNSISFDYNKLQELIDQRTVGEDVSLDDGLKFNSVKHLDVSFSLGYGYNWVFAKNWLLAGSLSMALAYKSTRSESDGSEPHLNLSVFKMSNLNIDGIGRFGLVWNNTRWYAGTSAIVRVYNYKQDRIAAHNIFGSLNIYAGYNFGARSAYKKKGKK
ncbi:MAG: DUF4421 domain-containing protein [Prevotella sp.]|nr:DUF4421 domain-containing protein [Prevotella sp.]